MVRQLLLGFQLDLYAEQYATVYWYCDRITQMRIQNKCCTGHISSEILAHSLTLVPINRKVVVKQMKMMVSVLKCSLPRLVGVEAKEKNKGKKREEQEGKSAAPPQTPHSNTQPRNVGKASRLSIDARRHDRHIHYRELTELDLLHTLFRSYPAC